MQPYKELLINQKIKEDCFYCPSDTVYFNNWTKLFILSAKENAPWAKIHVHIFDINDNDKKWCDQHSITYTYESTPNEFSNNIESKKDYWVNIRFCRISEIFDKSATVLAIDSDSIFNKSLTKQQFDNDTSYDWVAQRDKGVGSLGSCVLFSKNSEFRNIIKSRLLLHWGTEKFKWYLDQEILDDLVNENLIQPFDMSYNDFRCRADSFIWTGKGDRKFKKRFPILADKYRKLLESLNEK